MNATRNPPCPCPVLCAPGPPTIYGTRFVIAENASSPEPGPQWPMGDRLAPSWTSAILPPTKCSGMAEMAPSIRGEKLSAQQPRRASLGSCHKFLWT